MQKTVAITVSGKVQGVFYRHHTWEKAKELGITGSVCNLEDGSVRIIATGNEQQLAILENWCWRGPARAVVTGVEIAEQPLQSFDAFIIRR